jgi:hypothetical protein
MKLPHWITIHAILLIASGIAFAMYDPLMLAFFAASDILEDPLTYWHVAAFARMFGALLFGMGLLLWALRSTLEALPGKSIRGLIAALLLGSLVALLVSLTQQSAIWGTLAGWITSGIFIIISIGLRILHL